MRYLLDTDHISFLQLGSGPEFTTLSARMAGRPSVDFALSVVGFHEQMLGGHAYINRGRTTRDVIRGYEVLSQVLQSYLAAARPAVRCGRRDGVRRPNFAAGAGGNDGPTNRVYRFVTRSDRAESEPR